MWWISFRCRIVKRKLPIVHAYVFYCGLHANPFFFFFAKLFSASFFLLGIWCQSSRAVSILNQLYYRTFPFIFFFILSSSRIRFSRSFISRFKSTELKENDLKELKMYRSEQKNKWIHLIFVMFDWRNLLALSFACHAVWRVICIDELVQYVGQKDRLYTLVTSFENQFLAERDSSFGSFSYLQFAFNFLLHKEMIYIFDFDGSLTWSLPIWRAINV